MGCNSNSALKQQVFTKTYLFLQYGEAYKLIKCIVVQSGGVIFKIVSLFELINGMRSWAFENNAQQVETDLSQVQNVKKLYSKILKTGKFSMYLKARIVKKSVCFLASKGFLGRRRYELI